MVTDSFVPHRFRVHDAKQWIHTPTAGDDKYRRGVVGVRTGSNEYPGAAVLGVSAAWFAGAGMVRYQAITSGEDSAHGLPTPAAAVLAARPETVFGAGHSDAWVIGSGSGERTFTETQSLEHLLGEPAPVVLDAGGLDLAREASAPLILTPHWGEFRKLWQQAGFSKWPSDEDPNLATRGTGALRLAHKYDAVILLKGSETVVASPTGELWVVGPNSPFLASAGTGDVLAGLLGSLLATAVKHRSSITSAEYAEIAATAALVHSRAAEIASGAQHTDGMGSSAPHTITALQVAAAIPYALAGLSSR